MDLKAFAASAAELTDLARTEEVEAYVEFAEQRRTILFRLAGSDVLRDCFQAIDGRVRWVRYQNLAQPGRMVQSIEEHRGVAQAVSEGDAERAAELTAAHVGSATRSLAVLIGRGFDGDPPHGPAIDWRQVKSLLEPIS
jgi:DNA-binding GntR family transcriptional regulator